MQALRCEFYYYMITKYHAKYYANLLTQKAVGGELATISQSLLSSSVDINPHQIDAALFAFKSPLSKGVVLADEVGLGKAIEAGLVICQYWALGKRKILIVCPASLGKRNELEDREDEISAQRKQLLAELEKRMIQTTSIDDIFFIAWNTL